MSSSFKDENKNSGSTEEDSSFYSFLASILIVFIIYYFFKICKKIFYKIPFDEKQYINCHCSKCIKRIKEYNLKIKRKNINLNLLLNIIFFLFLLYLFIACSQKVQKKEIFDPYEILEISPTDQISKIKKSYKKLSLKYHPDKLMKKQKIIIIDMVTQMDLGCLL